MTLMHEALNTVHPTNAYHTTFCMASAAVGTYVYGVLWLHTDF